MYCSNCGKELEDDALFCQECGQEVERAPNEVLDRKTGRRNMYFIIGIVVGLVVVVFAAIFLSVQNKKVTEEKTDVSEKIQQEEQNGKTAEDTEDGEVSAEKSVEDEYIFPHSDTEYLTDAQLETLTKEELEIARNEILARCGRVYTDEKYKAYFEGKSWYKGVKAAEEFDAAYDNELNDVEKANVTLIKKYENAFKLKNMTRKYYQDILQEYQRAESEMFLGSQEEYPHVNPLLFQYYGGEGEENPLYYSLVDLSGDGVPELFIAQIYGEGAEEYSILELYGYADGKSRQLEVEVDSEFMSLSEAGSAWIGDRVQYVICEDRLIRETSSSGAAENTVIYYELSENDVKMEMKKGAASSADIWDGDEMEIFYSTLENDGQFGEEITGEEYFEIEEDYLPKDDIEWHRLSELTWD